MKKTGPDKFNPWKAAGLVSAIGADLVVCVAGGYFAGAYLGEKTGRLVWVAAGVILGIIAGIFSIVMLIKRFLEDS